MFLKYKRLIHGCKFFLYGVTQKLANECRENAAKVRTTRQNIKELAISYLNVPLPVIIAIIKPRHQSNLFKNRFDDFAPNAYHYSFRTEGSLIIQRRPVH